MRRIFNTQQNVRLDRYALKASLFRLEHMMYAALLLHALLTYMFDA